MLRYLKKIVILICIAAGAYYLLNQISSYSKPLQYTVSRANSLLGNVEGNKGLDTMAKNPSSILVLVNKDYTLAHDFQPMDLVVPNVLFSESVTDEEKHIRKEAAAALEQLFHNGKEQGINLIATSGYRSYETQKRLYEEFVNHMGLEAAEYRAAQPGNSEHQTGLAMDITSSEFTYEEYQNFGETPGGKWVSQNAHHFGFIIRYPEGKEHITGYQYEPWHLRYVGVEQATYMFENQLTFEEYLGEV
ncbi:LAS superfamily LD-carboxypeptidase LdcB [Bacillus oleivorans]|uniref:LAS superfamily LD-carboxypeptidase LdcB n=1 Tax=Bacillus oleivorans TaxID=1448271 RepID=A0A285D2L3_9BACI|nr:M15 family metallopeptidase [Bacillus oleivorans]SNX74054.1 LAS superfamily LD-carboxypeptidase LdcB [Bacillus oleivorans]